MKTVSTFALLGAFAIGCALSAAPAYAQDCDAMLGEIEQRLESSDLSQEKKEQVMRLRDQGMAENGRAGGDCTTTLEQALAILNGEE